MLTLGSIPERRCTLKAISLPATIRISIKAKRTLFLARPTRQIERYRFVPTDDVELLLTPAILNGHAWVIFPNTAGHGLRIYEDFGIESLETYFGDEVIEELKGISCGGVEGDLFLGG